MRLLSAYELDDLYQAVAERIDDALLSALSLANRTGELSELLRLLGMDGLIGEGNDPELAPKRVAVLGDSAASVGALRSLVRKAGFEPGDFEFALGYDELKHYDFAKFRNSLTYRAVLVGPMPHSTPGKRGASSAVAEMQAHPEMYPPVIEMRDSNGLKITNNSFKRALGELGGMS